jgi:hypothetical protein
MTAREDSKHAVIPNVARTLLSIDEAINSTTKRNSDRLLFVAGGGDF